MTPAAVAAPPLAAPTWVLMRPSADCARIHLLQTSHQVNEMELSNLQENLLAPAAGAAGRLKRKDVSPNGKSGPLAKRTTAAALITMAAPFGAAPAGAGSSSACADDNAWEAVAAETGWTLADCLGHKVAFAKRADAKGKVEVLATHVKRLRAAGWHLLDARDRAAADAEVASTRLAEEQAARQEDREAADAALQEVQRDLGALTQAARRTEAELGERQAQVRLEWGWAAVGGGSRGADSGWAIMRLVAVRRRVVAALCGGKQDGCSNRGEGKYQIAAQMLPGSSVTVNSPQTDCKLALGPTPTSALNWKRHRG